MSNTARQARLLRHAMGEGYFDLITRTSGGALVEAPQPVEAATIWPAMMDRRIADARTEMGEAKWRDLQADWPQ